MVKWGSRIKLGMPAKRGTSSADTGWKNASLRIVTLLF
jgi:hypothetical protein